MGVGQRRHARPWGCRVRRCDEGTPRCTQGDRRQRWMSAPRLGWSAGNSARGDIMAKWMGAALVGCAVALTVAGCGGSTDTGPTAAAVRVVQAPPASIANGALIPVEVQLVESTGGALSRSGVEIRAALGAGQGTLGGAERAWTDGNGRAAFSNLSIAGPVG